MKAKRRLTVSIGIPAYNEEQNIVYLLSSLFKQKQINFSLEKIFVICDGCTDKTSEKIMSLVQEHPEIVLIDDHQRKGKVMRLNELHKRNKSDILILLDADLLILDTTLITKLVSYFNNSKVVAVVGNNQPVPGKSFVEKVINNWYAFWYEARKDVNNGYHIHNMHSAILAQRRSFGEKIIYPKGVISNAQYLHFATKKNKQKIPFAKDAVAYYYSPASIKDYLLQSNRYGSEKEKYAAIFGNWIYKEYGFSRMKKILALLRIFLFHPILTSCGFFIELFLQLRQSPSTSLQKKGLWERVASTKRAMDPRNFSSLRMNT